MEEVSQNQVEKAPVETSAVEAAPRDERQLWEVRGEEREQLDALSKEVFGASSRWQSLVTKGYSELVTEEVEEYVPEATDKDGKVTPGFNRKVRVPVKRKDGALQSTKKYHDIKSVTIYMLDRKAQLDKIKAEVKRMQDEARAKKEADALAKRVHEDAQGSAAL